MTMLTEYRCSFVEMNDGLKEMVPLSICLFVHQIQFTSRSAFQYPILLQYSNSNMYSTKFQEMNALNKTLESSILDMGSMNQTLIDASNDVKNLESNMSKFVYTDIKV